MGRTIDRVTINRDISYAPLPTQARFHASKARYKGYSGPVGSGKSQALCQEAIKLCYLNPGRTGLLGAPTYPMLRDATLTALVETLESNRIPYELHKAENVLALEDTDSRILLRSLEDYERLRGTNLAWFGVDELTYVKPDAWDRLEGRLRDPKAKRLCGFSVWTPKGQDWVFKKFIEHTRQGFELFRAEPFENRHLLGAVPDFYEQLRSSYSDAFFRQEVLGEYLTSNDNRVYQAFERSSNVKPTALDSELPLLWALDFNVDPMCSVVAQVQGEEVLVLDEIVLHRASTTDACEQFHGRFPKHATGVLIYGDATGKRLQTAGTTDFGMIRQYFLKKRIRPFKLKVPNSNPPVRDRIELVNSRLRSADGEVHLRIDPRCERLIEDLEAVSYRSGTSEIDKTKDKQLTHLSDALGYLLWEEFRSIQPNANGKRRLI